MLTMAGFLTVTFRNILTFLLRAPATSSCVKVATVTMAKYMFEDQILLYCTKRWFWILGTLFVISSLASITAARAFHTDPPQGVSKDECWPQQPVFTAWLAPHLTTTRRKRIALAIYLGGLGFQMLEGYWILITVISWTGVIPYQWPDPRTVSIGLSFFYVVVFAFALFIDLILIVGWGTVIMVQVMSAFEITESMSRYTGEKRKTE